MTLLIVGGTIFLGRWLVAAAGARGHEVTIFSRGRHVADLSAEVEQLRGDRNGDVSALEGRSWDVVIDTCGYTPSGIRHVMRALDRRRVGLYLFVSSVSAYARYWPDGLDESGPVGAITGAQLEEAERLVAAGNATAWTFRELYGPLKALCESAAEEMMPGRVLNVRPGLIVGPYDYSDRFTYWVRRLAAGGEVLAPGKPARRVRVIDARDLADWLIRMGERQAAGLFNATGAEDGLSMGSLLELCRDVSGANATLRWVSDEFLLRRDVAAWSELPLWIPDENNGIFEVRNDKAIAAGLRFRQLAETIEDTLAWDAARPQHVELKAGLSRDRERRLLNDAANSSH